ncbi:MAG: nucleotidyltransferase, partial [Ignisphaera sp.]
LFVTSLSPLLEEAKIRQIAYMQGWSTGTTDLGTPSITINVDDVEITIELYENIMDFYIPVEALDLCKKNIDAYNTNIYYVAPECWMIFKARRGSGKDIAELSMLKYMVEEGTLSIDKSLIEKLLNFYEEDKHHIVDRLKSIKLM